MKRIADGVEFRMPATIDDPVILDEISDSLKSLGYAGTGE
jgi:propionyl-CoA synthetase